MRTTQERISDLIELEFEFYPSKTEGRCEVRCDHNGNKAGIERCAKQIAAEIDALIAQLSSSDKSREATENRLNSLESALASSFHGGYAAEIYAMRAEMQRLRMACGMAYVMPGAGDVEVNAVDPVAGMQAIAAAVNARTNDILNRLDEARAEGRREFERHANTAADLKRYVDGHAFVVRERDALAAELATLRDEVKAGDERFEKWEAEAMEREANWRAEREEWIGLVLHHWANRAPVSKTTLDDV